MYITMKVCALVGLLVCLLGYTEGAALQENSQVDPGYNHNHPETRKVPYAKVTCYHCSYSSIGEDVDDLPYFKGCKDPFEDKWSNITTASCDGKCVKLKLTASQEDFVVIERSCVRLCFELDEKKNIGGLDLEGRSHCCSGDHCNTAVCGIDVSFAVVTLCLILARLFQQ